MLQAERGVAETNRRLITKLAVPIRAKEHLAATQNIVGVGMKLVNRQLHTPFTTV